MPSGIPGVTCLDVQQKVYIWTKACDQLLCANETGENLKRAKRAGLVLLATGWFGADPESIRRSLNRHGTTIESIRNLADGR